MKQQDACLINGFGGYAGGIVRVHNALCRELSSRAAVSVASAPLGQEKEVAVRVLSRQSISRRESFLSDARASWPPRRFDYRIDSAPALRFFTRSAVHVVVVHDLNFVDRRTHRISFGQLVYRWLLHRWTLPRVDLIVANSDSTRAELEAFMPRIADKILVLPLPVDHVVARHPRTHWGRKVSGETRVLTFGHARNKGVDHLIRLMDVRPDIQLTVICTFSHWEEFWKDLAADYGVSDRISVRSGLDDDLLFDEYVSTDVFCMLSGYEGYGLPVAEALVLGTPTVISEISVLSATARGHAISAPPTDAVALSAAIDRAIDSPARVWQSAADEFSDWNWNRWTTTLVEEIA